MKPVTMAEIALAAIKFKAAISATKVAQEALTAAYFSWKCAHDKDFVMKNSDEWDEMMLATAEQYKAVRRKKDAERRALKKLLQTCPFDFDEEVAA